MPAPLKEVITTPLAGFESNPTSNSDSNSHPRPNFNPNLNYDHYRHDPSIPLYEHPHQLESEQKNEEGEQSSRSRSRSRILVETSTMSQNDTDLEEGTLQFPLNKLFGREDELQRLEDAFTRVISPDETPGRTGAATQATKSRVHVALLEGLSGTGKSAIAMDFVQRKQASHSVIVGVGKYCEPRSNFNRMSPAATSLVPYSGIAEALAVLTRDFLTRKPLDDLLVDAIVDTTDDIRETASEDHKMTDVDFQLLLQVMPGLQAILGHGDEDTPPTSPRRQNSLVLLEDQSVTTSNTRIVSNHSSTASTSAAPNSHVDQRRIAVVVSSFLRLLARSSKEATRAKTLILVLDDIQWMDIASFDLLQTLWNDTSLSPWMFIGIARSSLRQDFSKSVVEKVKENLALHSAQRFDYIEIENLSFQQISKFIAETLEQDSMSEIQELAKVVFSQSLGNIFISKQIIEAMHRKGTIYYDMVVFEWQYNLEKFNLKDFEPGADAVLEMIQDKLNHLNCEKLKNVLIVTSYLRPTIDIDILGRLFDTLRGNAVKVAGLSYDNLDSSNLLQCLQNGVHHGFLLMDDTAFRFVHDRVQEACFELVPSGEHRGTLRGKIGDLLLRLSMPKYYEENDLSATDHEPQYQSVRKSREWMLFLALEHLNSIQQHLVPCDIIKLIQANFLAGCLCLAKASFEQARTHFSVAVTSLPESFFWKNHYILCLSANNRLMETEFALGNNHEATQVISTILRRATKCRDKIDAYYTKIQMMDREEGCKESVKVLCMYGHCLPTKPTKSDILMERIRLKVALGTRSIGCIADLPMMKDDRFMKLLAQLSLLSNLSGNAKLGLLVGLRSMRVSLEHGVTKYLLVIMADYSTPMRHEGKLSLAYSFASVIDRLHNRFPDERGSEYVTSRVILHAGMLHLKDSFAKSLDAMVANYRMAMAAGNIEIALVSAMFYPLIFFANGLPLKGMLEPKILFFQNKSRELGRHNFVAVFQLCRQFIFKLQGRTNDGNSKECRILTEEEICLPLDEKTSHMTLRDSAILNLVLAFAFDDEETLLTMSTRLDDHPIFDLPIVRQHLRMTFQGLACSLLGRRREDEELREKGLFFEKELKQLEQSGSFSARPAYLCIKAIRKHSSKMYKKAIKACARAHFIHMEAMMNEHLALYYMDLENGRTSGRNLTKPSEKAQEYIESALYLYEAWGAQAKVNELRQKYPCIKKETRDWSSACTRDAPLTSRVKRDLDGLQRTPDQASPRNSRAVETQRRPLQNSSSTGLPSMPRRSLSPTREIGGM